MAWKELETTDFTQITPANNVIKNKHEIKANSGNNCYQEAWIIQYLWSPQSCLINMTDMAFQIIYCMESSSDVLSAVESVSMFLCLGMCVHFNWH